MKICSNRVRSGACDTECVRGESKTRLSVKCMRKKNEIDKENRIEKMREKERE